MRAVVLALFAMAALVGTLAVGVQVAGAQETPLPPTVAPTEIPAPTAEPPTEPPATEAPQSTDAAPTEEPAVSPTPEGEDDGDDEGGPSWLIIGLIIAGAVLLVILIASWFGRRGGSAAASTATWQSRSGDTYGKAAALHDAIGVELASSTPLTDDAEARQRWQEIQRRIDELTAELHTLQTMSPNEQQSRTLTQMLASLAALRSATLPAAPSAAQATPEVVSAQAAQIRQRLSEFDTEVRAFRGLM